MEGDELAEEGLPVVEEGATSIHPGMCSQWISVVPIQWASCISLTSSPTETSRTEEE